MSVQKKALKTVDRIIEGMAWIAGLLLLFMMFSICYEVILRYFNFRPPTWVTEITEYILLYVTFLGAPWVLKEDGHVKVDIVISRLGLRARKTMDILTSIFGMGVCCVLVWFGTNVTLDHYQRNIPVIKALEVPKFLLLGIIPIGSAILIIQFIRRARGLWIGKRVDDETVEGNIEIP